MEIDLSKKLSKVWHESERSVYPDETIERAIDAIKTLGVAFDITFQRYGGVFWTATMAADLNSMHDRQSSDFRVGGKGQSKKQCHASCLMEFIERWSLFRHEITNRHEFDCFDLRNGQYYKINRTIDFGDTKCVSAGNNFEEAVLHSLHELIETRRFCIWKPYKLVEIDMLFSRTALPEWVADNIVLIKMPSDHDEFHIFTAVIMPSGQCFDSRVSDYIEKKFDDDVFVGVVDLTDPAIGIPVIKLITDYDPRQSIVSKQVLELFFEFE